MLQEILPNLLRVVLANRRIKEYFYTSYAALNKYTIIILYNIGYPYIILVLN